MPERTCSIEGCEKPKQARGWCNAHYQRWLRTGDTGEPLVKAHPKRPPEPKTCSIDGCDRKHYGKGLCNAHWLRQRRRGTTEPWQPADREVCIVEGCENIEYSLTTHLCGKHYLRNLRHGDIDHERPDRRGEDHPSWKGDDIGYVGIHARVRRTYGRASEHLCVECDGQAQDWAYDHLDEDERIEVKDGYPLPYSTSVDHYRPMCKECHVRFDGTIEKLLRGRRAAV